MPSLKGRVFEKIVCSLTFTTLGRYLTFGAFKTWGFLLLFLDECFNEIIPYNLQIRTFKVQRSVGFSTFIKIFTH